MTTQFVRDTLHAIEEKLGKRLDQGESIFFERQLESVEARLYEKKFRELKYRSLIPVSNRDGEGAETITYYLYTKVGMAKIIANPSDDLPRSDVFASRFTQKVHVIGTSFGYSTQELRSARFAGVALELFKVDASRRSIREKENGITWLGDANYGIVGLFANPNIPTIQAPLNAGGGSRLWSAKTQDEIIADIRLVTSGIRDATQGVHEANTLVMPITQYDIIANTPRSTLSDTTILQFISNPGNSFGLDMVTWLTDIKGQGIGGSDMCFAYQRDSEILELRIPMEMRTHPPQLRNLEFVIPVEAENGGTVVRYPLACRFLYDI